MTKEQKLEAYEAVKAGFERREYLTCACCWLDDYARRFGEELTFKTRIDFPEFFAQMPEGGHACEAWWIYGDTEPSIKALEAAISLCKSTD